MAPCWLDDDICVWILRVWSIIEDAAHEAFIRFGNHGNVDAVSSDILAGKYSVGDLWVVFVLVFGFQACALNEHFTVCNEYEYEHELNQGRIIR